MFYNVQVNLFLRVVRRREDGYHDLASLFHVSMGSWAMLQLLSAKRQHCAALCFSQFTNTAVTLHCLWV